MSASLLKSLLRTRSLWIALVLVVIAELVVRVSLPSGKIPRGAYHSSEFRQQVAHYADAVPVDMLLIGSSVAAVNYPAMPLDTRLAELGMDGFTTFNGGIRGCNYECIATGIRRHYLNEFRPPVALFVISPADLNIDNSGVVARSHRFAADMERGIIARTARQALSRISYLYGFKEEVREWLISGQWNFDPAEVSERGYVDMGSIERGRNTQVPRITPDSALTLSLKSLVNELVDSGTRVILVTTVGDSLARFLFTDEAQQQLDDLLASLTQHPDVHELAMDTSQIPDTDYIDTSHLTSEAAIINAQRFAEHLFESGLLEKAR